MGYCTESSDNVSFKSYMLFFVGQQEVVKALRVLRVYGKISEK
jgi:hypothetical protein